MSYNILIVDDSATTRAIIRRTIGMCGIDVATIHEACNGLEGLKVVTGNPVDLVLADLHMPEMDGVEMIRRMMADPKTARVPVVIVSAEPNLLKIAALKEQGAKGHLRKPFTPEGVRETITRILETRHAA